MWVQLLTVQQIEIAGVARAYHPGDWVEVGRQKALLWIANGQARAMPSVTAQMAEGGGVVALGGVAPALGNKIAVTAAEEPVIPYEWTCILNPGIAPLRAELLPVGFQLLRTWEVAAPLLAYDVLAEQVGTEEERRRTREVVRDLRVPVYDPALLYLRRCEAAEALLRCWAEERACPWGRDYLGFLRALYRVKPLLLALPTSWMGKRQPG